MIASLSFRTFRNYGSLDLDISDGLTIFEGQNGHGKTNILEGVHVLSTGKLLRGSKDADAIQFGEAGYLVRGTLRESDSVVEVEAKRGSRKRATLNGMSLKRVSDLMGRIPSVTFAPEDIETIRGEPSERRQFVDLALAQVSPPYLGALAGYKRALEQRNALLKLSQERPVSAVQFETWEEELGRFGSEIREFRRDFLREIGLKMREIHSSIQQSELLETHYCPFEEAWTLEQLMQAYEENRAREIQRGSTMVGPHRDDFRLDLNGHDVRTFGSQGQQRSAGISLKLATLVWTGETLGCSPILLLDDVFSELDAGRRERLVETARKYAGQIVLTCTERAQAGELVDSRSMIYFVHQGTVKPA